MTILALDSARVTGWAHLRENGTIVSGVKELGPKDMRIGPLLLNFDRWLAASIENSKPTWIYYEQPFSGTNQKTSFALMALAGQIELAGFRGKVMVRPILNPVFIAHYCKGAGALKRKGLTATERRKARKDRTIAVCLDRGFYPKDDNEADALALLDYAMHNEHLSTGFSRGPLFAGAA